MTLGIGSELVGDDGRRVTILARRAWLDPETGAFYAESQIGPDEWVSDLDVALTVPAEVTT